MNKITRGHTNDAMPLAPVQPILVDSSRQSPQAAINAVNAESEKANMMNNIKIGGWIPKSKVKSKKIKDVKGGARLRRRRTYSRRGRRLTASDARVSRRLRMRMLQRRIKKRKSRRSGSLQRQMRGGQVQTVPQHGSSCTNPNDNNCPGNISKGMLDLNAQAAANSQGDSIKSAAT
jgi:hypothetical protein